MVELLDLETGETILRSPLDAREIIATGRGRYCYPKDAPTARGPEPELAVASAPAKKKRDVSKMLAAAAARRAAKKATAATGAASQE